MPAQSVPLPTSNVFVVTSVDPSTVDPTQSLVTLRALVPNANTNAVKVGQAYLLADATLTSNNSPGTVALPYGGVVA